MPETAFSTSGTGEGSGASQQGATEQVQDKAKEAAGHAQEKAREAGQQARTRVRDQVDQRSTQAGEQIRGNVEDVRSFANQLREQGKDTPARYAEQAADRAERLGGYLERSDGDAILRDVEEFGRRNPWAVVAGGVALGFIASRMLKASSGDRYRASQGNGSSSGDSRPPAASGYGATSEGQGATGGGIGAGTGTRPSQFEPHT